MWMWTNCLQSLRLGGPCPQITLCSAGQFTDYNCPADIAPFQGNGVVNVDDLLVVITNWGPCSQSGGDGIPDTIADCFNVYCAGLEGAEWQACIQKCIEAVCARNPSACH